MKFNKWTLGLAAVASLALFTPSTSKAQGIIDGYSQVTTPTVIQANMTTNLTTPQLIDCRKTRQIGLMIDASWNNPGDAAGANTNLAYVIAPSVDLVHYDTNKTWTITGYNRQVTAGLHTYSVTNIDSAGYRGFFLLSIQNNSAAGIATNSFYYSNKSAP